MIRIAVSAGCPCGIGPEVAIAAAARWPGDDVQIDLYADRGAIEDAATARGIDWAAVPHVVLHEVSALEPSERAPGAPGAAAGRAQLEAIDAALADVLRGADALVTGPVSKHAIAMSGTAFIGHTEYLQAHTGSPFVVMLFAGPRLRTALVTTHHAIRDVPALLTRDDVTRTVVQTARALRADFAVARPRVVVTGLNPHAGEHGLFGREEIDVIAPAIADASRELAGEAVLAGPMAAEAAYRTARDGAWDVVIAMFHDQATIASKLLDFGEAVNVTLGLPIVRTSVDHGTGYDIAGTGRADERGMLAAMTLAVEIARRRRA